MDGQSVRYCVDCPFFIWQQYNQGADRGTDCPLPICTRFILNALCSLLMDYYERIITYGAAAVIAVWYVYRNQYLPWKQKRDDDLLSHNIKASDDTREYEQATNTGALKQVINLNENLVKFLIELYDKLTSTLSQLPRQMGDVKTQMEISNRDRVRSEEIFADIDILLHEIKAGQELIIKLLNGSTKTDD